MDILTIFTPTYNRAYILPKLYQSLCAQENKNFDWLIVDDGSTDNTKELVEQWKNENIINITYHLQQNGGKMRAHNQGVKMCETELFLCVDSDDYLNKGSIEMILDNYSTWKDNENIAGAVAYRGKSETETIENEFPINQNTSLGDLYRAGFKGDTSLIYRTSILKQYLFPEIEGEKFITEDYVYSQIDEKYKMTLLPKILIVCEYLSDGYTKNAIKLVVNNAKGMTMYYNMKIKLAKSFKERCMFVVRYTSTCKLSKLKNAFKRCNSRFLYALLYPFSWIYYRKKLKLYKSVVNNGK